MPHPSRRCSIFKIFDKDYENEINWAKRRTHTLSSLPLESANAKKTATDKNVNLRQSSDNDVVFIIVMAAQFLLVNQKNLKSKKFFLNIVNIILPILKGTS